MSRPGRGGSRRAAYAVVGPPSRDVGPTSCDVGPTSCDVGPTFCDVAGRRSAVLRRLSDVLRRRSAAAGCVETVVVAGRLCKKRGAMSAACGGRGLCG